MTPTWQTDDGRIQLYCGDCLTILPEIGKVDAVITDPPYGIGHNNIVPGGPSKFHLAKLTQYKTVNWDIKNPDVIKSCALFKDSVIFGGNYYADVLPLSRGWVVWDKRANGRYADGELIWTNKDVALQIFRYTWSGMLKQKPEIRYHPTQKPVELIERLLVEYSPTSEIVLDPFMGSGTTGIACIRTGRKFIGIEISPEYFEIAKNRIKIELQQQLLAL